MPENWRWSLLNSHVQEQISIFMAFDSVAVAAAAVVTATNHTERKKRLYSLNSISSWANFCNDFRMQIIFNSQPIFLWRDNNSAYFMNIRSSSSPWLLSCGFCARSDVCHCNPLCVCSFPHAKSIVRFYLFPERRNRWKK